MSSAEGIVDICNRIASEPDRSMINRILTNIAEGSETFAELLNLALVGLGLIAVLVLRRAFFLNVESEVFEQNPVGRSGWSVVRLYEILKVFRRTPAHQKPH